VVVAIVLLVAAIATPIYKVAEELQRMNDRHEERDNERAAAREDDDP
jgi:hypothetical protein